ncbi:MAG: sensor histidine kinase, partial [Vicinamibacterales bacterium]
VDLNALCAEAAAAAQAPEPGAAVHLSLDPDLTHVIADHERLRLALVNMLVNARHAVNGATAPEGAAPLVSLTTAADGDRARIVIADRGAGIDAGDLSRVFDPYFTTKRGGTGLGLPIAKNIVEGLGGTIAVASAPGRGTEIRVELPRS